MCYILQTQLLLVNIQGSSMETSTNNFLLVSVPTCNYRNKGDMENICSYSTVIQNNTYKQAAVKYGFILKVLLGGRGGYGRTW